MKLHSEFSMIRESTPISKKQNVEFSLAGMSVTWVENCLQPAKFSEITLSQALDLVKGGQYKAQIECLRRENDKKSYSDSKKALPCIAFNGCFKESVTNDNFERSSQLFHFDLDDLEGDIDEHKWHIASIPSCAFVFISPSGKGLKGALHMGPAAIQSDADFKLFFLSTAI